jgi:hypothetical protein
MDASLQSATLPHLLQACELGLDRKRLLFARFLVLSGRLNEGWPAAAGPGGCGTRQPIPLSRAAWAVTLPPRPAA